MLLVLPVLGLVAGALTTLAGMGGGLLLVLALSLGMHPVEALATSAPALLLGNLHRGWAHRAEVDRRVAVALASGGLVGSLAGGFAAASIPPAVLRALLVVTVIFALARAAGLLRKPIRLPTIALWPAGFGVGATAATSGGAGLLVSPLLLSTGLTGQRYVATSAVIAVALHVGRLVAYGAEGFMTRATLASAAVLTAAILAGNLLGERIRPRLGARLASRLESGVLLACVVLALAGLR